MLAGYIVTDSKYTGFVESTIRRIPYDLRLKSFRVSGNWRVREVGL